MFPVASEPANGSFVRDQIEDLRALGVDLDVLVFDGRGSRMEYVRAARRLRSALRASAFDIIHAHYGLTGAVAMTQARVPVVTTFHGSDAGYVPWQRRVSWVVARATTPIFVSRLGAAGLGLPKATVIPAGVDTTQFAPMDTAEARAQLGWSRDRRFVLFPGARRNRVKGIDLFDAAVRLVQSEVGDIESIALEGFSREEVVLVMNAVNAVMMTSKSEGSPVTIKEALACRKPVVSVAVGDVPEMIHGLPGCAICPRDAAALAMALASAVSHAGGPELRERAKLYERQKMAMRVHSFYETCLSSPDGRVHA
jgi:glycosyltransferase involved in cell wall biosynthesis